MANRARNSGDLIALTVLVMLLEEPMHPYQIQRLVRERRKTFAEGKTRSLYHAVERLVADDLIEPVETSREGRRPERTVYRITEEGREEVGAWLGELLESTARRESGFEAAVSFVGYMSSDEVRDHLAARCVALEAEIAAQAAALRAIDAHMRLPRIVLLETELNIRLRRAELEWVRELIEDITTAKLAWDRESLRRHFEEGKTWAKTSVET